MAKLNRCDSPLKTRGKSPPPPTHALSLGNNPTHIPYWNIDRYGTGTLGGGGGAGEEDIEGERDNWR
jgi:hypothetical protein